jgi:hypothetical protein
LGRAAIRTVGLFVSLRGVLTEYPSPPSVQAELLGHLREVLRRTLPDEPEAVRLVGSRGWTGELKGEGLIDAIQEANEGLARLGDVKIYAEFVEEWYGGDLDADLVSGWSVLECYCC